MAGGLRPVRSCAVRPRSEWLPPSSGMARAAADGRCTCVREIRAIAADVGASSSSSTSSSRWSAAIEAVLVGRRRGKGRSSSRAAKAAPAVVGGGTVVRARGPLCNGTRAALGRSGRARRRASAAATTRSMSTPGSVWPCPEWPAPLTRLWPLGAAAPFLVVTSLSAAPPTPRDPRRAPRVPRCSVNQRFLPARMRARSWASMEGSSASPLLPTACPAPPLRSAASASVAVTVGGCRAPG